MADPKHTTLTELNDLIDKDFVEHKKIDCIKLLRQITGEGLKETKEFFEDVWQPFITSQPPNKMADTLQLHIGGIDNITTVGEKTRTSDLPPPMYLVGQAYKQLDGCAVLILGVSNPNTSYETIYSLDKEGNIIHRYNRRDFGRCTGSDHQNPDPRNLEILT